MNQKDIARINELYRKQKAGTLTPERSIGTVETASCIYRSYPKKLKRFFGINSNSRKRWNNY